MQAGGSGPSSEEWREFRRQLISGGIKLTTDESEPNDGGSEAVSERKVIAPGNEALLRSQNAQLYQEYIKGSWAHESPVEAGGLLLRMPLEAQLTHFLRDGAGTDLLGDELRQRLRKEVSALEDGGGEERFDNWLSNTPYCYRLCEGFIAEQLEKLAAQARRGQVTVDAKSMSGSLLRLYQRANQEWQQVVLVFSIGGGGAASGVAISTWKSAVVSTMRFTATRLSAVPRPAITCSISPARMMTLVVPSPTSSSCALLSSIMLLAAG